MTASNAVITTTAGRSRILAVVGPAVFATAVLLQVGYPLVHGATRAHLAVLVVVALAIVGVVHAASSRSWAVALAMLAISAGLGFAVEVVGVHTGLPFGSYRYTGVLGVQLFDVPLVVPLAWTMLAWPATVVARSIVAGPVARVAVGAWALTAADLFLDPQLVALGAWRWAEPAPYLPGLSTVPLTNFAGWLAVSLVLSAVLQRMVGDAAHGSDALATGLYLWLWIGWTVAQLIFLDLRASAAWGFAAMGSVGLPLIRHLATAPVAREASRWRLP